MSQSWVCMLIFTLSNSFSLVAIPDTPASFRSQSDIYVLQPFNVPSASHRSPYIPPSRGMPGRREGGGTR